jgi:hypothetical protein
MVETSFHIITWPRYISAYLLCIFFLFSSAPSPSSVDLSPYFSWVSQQLQGEDLRLVDLTVQELESILRIREYRMPFWETPKAAES